MEHTVYFGRHIAHLPRDVSLCTGCHSCEMMCGLSHNGAAGPANGRIQVELDSVKSMLYTVYSCQQCSDHPCYDACPKRDSAMCIDEESGIVYINESNCIGCGKCQKACRLTPSRITFVRTADRKKRKARKCDLCRGRAEGPACVEHCSARCLYLSESGEKEETENG